MSLAWILATKPICFGRQILRLFKLAAIPVNIRCLGCFTFWLSLVLITSLQCCYYKSHPYKWASNPCNILTFCKHLEDQSQGCHVNLCLLQSEESMLLLRLIFIYMQLSQASVAVQLQYNWGQSDTSRKGAKTLGSLDWKYLLHSN